VLKLLTLIVHRRGKQKNLPKQENNQLADLKPLPGGKGNQLKKSDIRNQLAGYKHS
jgi:hypothetical protein